MSAPAPAPAPVQVNADDIEVTLKLKPRQIGVVLGGLEQLPLGVAAPIYNHIRQETERQVGAAVAAAQVKAEEKAVSPDAPSV